MVQILPEAPNFAALLGRGVGQGLGSGISQAAQMASQLGLQRAQSRQQQEFISSLLGGRRQQSSPMQELAGESQSEGMELTPEKVLAISTINPQLGSVLSNLYKVQEKKAQGQKEESLIKNTAQQSFNGMADILRKGDVGLGSTLRAKLTPTKRGEQIAESVGEFQALSGGLESILVDMVSRGALSKTRFEYITQYLLPQAGDREATIRGKLKGLAKELNLDPSALEEKKTVKTSSSSQFVNMKDPSGVIRKVPKEKVAELMKLGGEVVR